MNDTRVLMFYHAGHPNFFMEEQTDKYGKASRQVEDIMSDFSDVPFYQVQTRTATDEGVKGIIRTYKNKL